VHFCCFGMAALAIICWMAFARDLWLPFLPPLLGSLAATAIVTGYTRYQERKDRETLMRLFSQNVSPAVADSIWLHRDEFMDGHRPRPQKLFVTVLFTDFRNFATISEKLQPTEAMDWVNQYLEALARQVERHGGLIDKYMGDAIMAVFGFPSALTGNSDARADACNAVTCALNMGKELCRLNESWQSRGLPPVQVRIGIFSGPAVAGSIGSSNRFEFTLIGNTVNTAERLESFEKTYAADDPCRILIGQSTFELLDGKFRTELVQSIKLKGQAEVTTIYRVLEATV